MYATAGQASLHALRSVDREDLAGKVLLDGGQTHSISPDPSSGSTRWDMTVSVSRSSASFRPRVSSTRGGPRFNIAINRAPA